MTEILLPDIPAFCKTRDDVLLLFARQENYDSREEALEDGFFNLKRRIIRGIIDGQKLAPVPAKQLAPVEQWRLFVQYLFQVQFLCDARNDEKNHLLATILLDIKANEYINTAPGLMPALKEPILKRRAPRDPVIHPAGRDCHRKTIRRFYINPAPKQPAKTKTEKPANIDPQLVKQCIFMRIVKTRSV